jgi:L,D-peptidoglycan transpeptidase YkuD (ErfK/YbiS/YcfS/YnhG family)
VHVVEGRSAIGIAVAAVTIGLAPAAVAGTPPPLTATAPTHHHLLVTRLKGIHNATQVISVTNPHYGSVHAKVQAFQKTSSGWRRVFGPWHSWIGRNGFAHPRHKREGDGKIPSGSYHFSYMFGVDANPGVHYHWRHAGPDDYWNDDSTTGRYNTWVHGRANAGAAPEPLHVAPYDYAAVIGYNLSRTPYRGSAIFLHVTHHSPTSGCVALARGDVVSLLRWLQPGDHARIIMGRTATVTR